MSFLIKKSTAGWSSLVARQAHNLEVVGSNPTPATNLLSLYCKLYTNVYIMNINVHIVNKKKFGGKMLPYIMPREKSIEIDNIFDLNLIKLFLEK